MKDSAQNHVNNKGTNIAPELEAWRARAVDVILIAFSVAGVFAAIPTIMIGGQSSGHWVTSLIILSLYLLVVFMAIYQRINYRIRVSSALLVGYTAAIITLSQDGLAGVGQLYLLTLPVLSLVILGERFGLITSLFSILIFSFFGAMAHFGWLENWLISTENPLKLLNWVANGTVLTMFLTGLIVLVWRLLIFQSRALETSQGRAQELTEAQSLLEERIAETERRAKQFEAIANVARNTTELLEPKEMLQQIVSSLKNQFTFDTVAIYLTLKDEKKPKISLEAITKEDTIPADRSRLMYAAKRAIQNASIGSISHLHKDIEVQENLVSLVLRSRGQILGILIIQLQENASSDVDIETLQVLSGQIATGLDNAQLLVESNANFKRIQSLYQQYTTRSWQNYLQGQQNEISYSEGITVQNAQWQEANERSKKFAELVSITQENESGEKLHSLAVPIQLRGLSLGTINFHRPISAGPWQTEEIKAINTIAERLILTIENIRLLEDSQRRAAREQLIGETSARIRERLDIESVLQTAVMEFHKALGEVETEVWLGAEE